MAVAEDGVEGLDGVVLDMAVIGMAVTITGYCWPLEVECSCGE